MITRQGKTPGSSAWEAFESGVFPCYADYWSPRHGSISAGISLRCAIRFLGLREMVERDIDNVEITDTAAVTEANQLAVEDEGHFLLGHTAV